MSNNGKEEEFDAVKGNYLSYDDIPDDHVFVADGSYIRTEDGRWPLLFPRTTRLPRLTDLDKPEASFFMLIALMTEYPDGSPMVPCVTVRIQSRDVSPEGKGMLLDRQEVTLELTGVQALYSWLTAYLRELDGATQAYRQGRIRDEPQSGAQKHN